MKDPVVEASKVTNPQMGAKSPAPKEPTELDLSTLDLSTLNIDEADLQTEEPSNFLNYLTLILLLGLIGFILWLPNSEWYRLYNGSTTLLFGLTIAATVVGVGLGKWLFNWAQLSAKRYALKRRQNPAKPLAPPKPSTPWERALTLLLAVTGIVIIAFVLPRSGLLYNTASGNYTVLWFITTISAFVVALFLGRWLLMQADNPFKNPKNFQAPRKPWPPWIKWLTLSSLLLASLVVLVGEEFLPGDPETLKFTLGGVAFIVGIVGAIWISKRFDEEEKRLRAEALRNKIR